MVVFLHVAEGSGNCLVAVWHIRMRQSRRCYKLTKTAVGFVEVYAEIHFEEVLEIGYQPLFKTFHRLGYAFAVFVYYNPCYIGISIVSQRKVCVVIFQRNGIAYIQMGWQMTIDAQTGEILDLSQESFAAGNG